MPARFHLFFYCNYCDAELEGATYPPDQPPTITEAEDVAREAGWVLWDWERAACGECCGLTQQDDDNEEDAGEDDNPADDI